MDLVPNEDVGYLYCYVQHTAHTHNAFSVKVTS